MYKLSSFAQGSIIVSQNFIYPGDEFKAFPANASTENRYSLANNLSVD